MPPHQGNIREFLDDLRVKKEELATVGVIIDDGDYRSTILSSLPTPLANFASMQLAAARMFSSVKTISPDVLIFLINEEADRQKVQKSCRQEGGKGKLEEKDEALFASAILEAEVEIAAEEDQAGEKEGVEEATGEGGSLALAWVNAGIAGRRVILE